MMKNEHPISMDPNHPGPDAPIQPARPTDPDNPNQYGPRKDGRVVAYDVGASCWRWRPAVDVREGLAVGAYATVDPSGIEPDRDGNVRIKVGGATKTAALPYALHLIAEGQATLA